MSTEESDTRSQQELVERFRSTGEKGWFAELYRRERRAVYVVCLKFLREPAAAEDVCHEAFVRAFERFDTLEGDNFSAWVRRIAANLSINRLRSAWRAAGEPSPQEAASDPSPERRLAGRRELEAALDIVRSLGDEQRQAFVMFHLEGLSYREIAERTGRPREAVRSHLQNARRNFHLRWDKTAWVREEAGDG